MKFDPKIDFLPFLILKETKSQKIIKTNKKNIFVFILGNDLESTKKSFVLSRFRQP